MYGGSRGERDQARSVGVRNELEYDNKRGCQKLVNILFLPALRLDYVRVMQVVINTDVGRWRCGTVSLSNPAA